MIQRRTKSAERHNPGFYAEVLSLALLLAWYSAGMTQPQRLEQKAGPAQTNAHTAAQQPMIMANGVSVASDFPHISVTTRENPAEGYIFINNWRDDGPYNIIFDDRGYPVWYMRTGYGDRRRDFKVQKNGVITMLTRSGPYRFLGFDRDFNQVDSYTAVDGYGTDEHELQVRADGSYYLIGIRSTTVDMSQYVSGGQKNAQVSESIVQGFSPGHQKIFQWRAWDHFDIRDVQMEDLRSGSIRFPHMNAIDFDSDGHLLLSSRHLSEITKIDLATGKIIWRLGGAHNQFKFINDPLNGFTSQHDIRAMGNGHYTLFDNGNLHQPPVSRAVEYALDLQNMTATLVWEYRNPPGSNYSYYMANAQRLANGNTLINWAIGDRPKATEVRPNGTVAYEMNFADQYHCYRAFRFPWNGRVARPYLIIEPYLNQVALIFNKFGDPDVRYYRIYADTHANATQLIDTSKTTLKLLSGFSNGVRYYFRVTAVDKNGLESEPSNEESLVINFTPAGQNMVRNGDFTQNNANWTFELQDTGQGSLQIINGTCRVQVDNPGPNIYDVQFRQNGLALTRGRAFLFEFDAWADQPRIIEAKVGQDNAPYINYSRIGLMAISNQKKHYQYTFTMTDPSDGNARVVFNCGKYNGSVTFDNVSLKEQIDSGVESESAEQQPERMVLMNYPNPFNAGTVLRFNLENSGGVELNVYDRIGRLVQTLAPGWLTAGAHEIKFEAQDLSSGVYFCRLAVSGRDGRPALRAAHKMILLR